MKKVLFVTSALVATSLVATTDAMADGHMDGFTVDVGGFMQQYIGYGSNKKDHLDAIDKKYNNINTKSNSEIHFSGKTSLDNGLDVSFKVELEADTKSGGTIDESYLTVAGDFGKVEMGNNDGASDQLHVGAPNVGPLGNANDFVSNNYQGSTDVSASQSGDDSKITYVSPSFEGFQIGASYTPQSGSEGAGGLIDRSDKISNIVSLGAAYSVDMGGASVAASVGYEFGDAAKVADDDDKPEKYDWLSAGLNVSMSGFTVGAEYGQRKGADNHKNKDKSTTYAVGASYAMDAASVSLYWKNSKYDAIEGIKKGGTAKDKDEITNGGLDPAKADKFDFFALGVDYKLGAGVNWKSTLGYQTIKNSKSKNSTDTEKADKAKSKNSGYVLATGIALSF